jgi:hypothetical protein
MAGGKHGPWVIVDRETGKTVERCPTVQGSEVRERAALLSRGTPTRSDNQSWGKLTKERARPGRGVKDGAIALRGGLQMPSPTECVERLVMGANPEIVAEIKAYQTTGNVLNLATLRDFLAQVVDPRAWAAFAEHRQFERFINSVSQRLYEKFGIRRANDRR